MLCIVSSLHIEDPQDLLDYWKTHCQMHDTLGCQPSPGSDVKGSARLALLGRDCKSVEPNQDRATTLDL